MNIPAELFRKLNEEIDIAPIILLDKTNCLDNHALDIIIDNEDMNTVLKMLKIKLIMIYKNKIAASDYDLTIVLRKLQEEELNRIHDVMLYALLIQESTNVLRQILDESLKSLSEVNEKYKQTTNFNLELLDVILETCKITEYDLVNVDPAYKNISKLLMNLLCNQEKEVQIKIVKDLIPKYIDCTKSYEILHLLWDDLKDNSFFYDYVLFALEQYFISGSKNELEFSVLDKNEFWTTLQNNITSENPFVKKQTVYLLKKSVQTLLQNERYIKSNPNSVDDIMQWNEKVTQQYKDAWKNFFILCDTSNEKQLHLIEPTFKLYKSLEPLHWSWRKCITKLFITHPHSAVIRYTVSQILTEKWNCDLEVLINGLNNNYLYDTTKDSSIFGDLVVYITNLNRDEFETFTELLARQQPSPVPFYHICKSLENLQISQFNLKVIIELIHSSEKVPHLYIRKAIQHSLFLQLNKIQLTDEQFQNDDFFDDLIKIIFLFVNIGYLKREHNSWKQILGYFKRDICTNKFVNIFSEMCKGNFRFSPKEYAVWCVILADLDHLQYDCSNIVKQIEMSNDCSVKLTFLLTVCHVINMYNAKEKKIPEVIGFVKEHMSILLDEMLTVCTEWRSQCCLEFVNNIELVIENIYFNQYIRDETCDLLLDFWDKLRDNGLYDWYIILSKKIIHIYDESTSTPEASQLIVIKENITQAKEKYLSDKPAAKQNVKRQILTNYYCAIMCLNSKWLIEDNIESNLNDYSEYYDRSGSEILLLVLDVLLKIPENMTTTFITSTPNDKYLELLRRCKTDIFNLRTSEIFRPAFRVFVKIISHPQNSPLLLEFRDSVLDEVFDASQTVTGLRNEIIQHALCGNNLTISIKTLAEALLYGPNLRKDQRIEFDTCAAISKEQYMQKLDKDLVNPCEFDAKVRSEAILVLLHVLEHSSNRYRISNNLLHIMKEKYAELSGKRYFGNSQIHFLKLRVMQTIHLLVNHLGLLQLHQSKTWLIHCLVNESEQPCIKLLMQWAIMRMGKKGLPDLECFITGELLAAIEETKGCSSLIPLIYHYLKSGNVQMSTVYYCMKCLLPYTMGPHFNIRCHAQETAKRIYEIYKTNKDFKNTYSLIYNRVCDVIMQTRSDKSFDVILTYTDLSFSLSTIYYDIPRLTNVTHTEWIPADHFDPSGQMKGVWNTNNSLKHLQAPGRKPTIVTANSTDGSTNVQKKIDPFRNVAIVSEVATSKTNLIVVASLIDRAPNLGGLSRTCEVFGVRQYVLNNAQFVKNKEYQSLSMSSEKWVDTLEVKVENLSIYLRDMQKKGYKVVGAEQTADSQSLDSFQFEKNTVLLLGNEKEGIPPNLIHLLDQCIEIPQFGQIRSLNVHVAGALFIWEYAKQHCKNN